MSNAQFRFSTDILRRLGEELNPTPDRGILELVKNAYDADALSCTIELIDTDCPGGSVRFSDDGDGMDLQAIENGWLILGRSPKSVKHRTQLGRIPSGSKGLGRLAALRMGQTAILSTRPRRHPTVQYDLLIDWEEYEKVDLVDEVVLNIRESQRAGRIVHGTEIVLQGLRSAIGRMAVKRLARALILLADPFGDDPAGFSPVLVAPEFKDLEALVKNRYFGDADYHLVAEVNDQGRVSASVVDWRGNELWSSEHDELTASRNKQSYNCPPARFDLWVFLLQAANFATRTVTVSEVRAWLQEFGGVHLYENGLRVMPYGNPGNDWLDMNLRRARSPEERPSTNTVIGRVSVSNTEELLVQKTDRSGFIESDAFIELRSFAQDAMEWMAARRMDAALKRRAQERATATKRAHKSREGVEKAIEDTPSESRQILKRAFAAYDRSRERETRELRKEIQLYRTLSTAGITAATFAHESTGNPIKVIVQSIKAIQRRAKAALDGQYDALLRKPVQSIIRAVDSLAVLGSATLSLIQYEKRRVGRVEVNTVVKSVLDTFKPFLDGRDVTVRTELCPGNPYLRGSEAAIESILTNLLNNSLAAFERSSTPERTILVRTTVAEDILTLSVLDNGPGIEGISLKDIWLPGKSTKRNGTGLGLAIVRDTVVDLGGTVDAVEHGELRGAEIIIELPILGV
jgi:C4-dicarboxylate-specific signal transduction histidine kinase